MNYQNFVTFVSLVKGEIFTHLASNAKAIIAAASGAAADVPSCCVVHWLRTSVVTIYKNTRESIRYDQRYQ